MLHIGKFFSVAREITATAFITSRWNKADTDPAAFLFVSTDSEPGGPVAASQTDCRCN